MKNVLEIEIGGPGNESLHFRPLGLSVRGRFDLMSETEPLARMKSHEWPGVIPGQRIGIDLDSKEGFVIDPLHDTEHKAVREKIASRGFQIPPARQSFGEIDVVSWVFWLKRAIESGIARIVSGTLPTLKGTPRKNYILAPSESREDKLIAAIDRQNQLFEALLEKLKSK